MSCWQSFEKSDMIYFQEVRSSEMEAHTLSQIKNCFLSLQALVDDLHTIAEDARVFEEHLQLRLSVTRNMVTVHQQRNITMLSFLNFTNSMFIGAPMLAASLVQANISEHLGLKL
ncbi:uncharacterized protein PG998_010520 [Apiospora kogelbergensis]|uniref:uncharacterized protein n=1 Tax=Apiospora kogelbergensis TaxID=1337665 RepID=UPI00312DF9E8